MIPINAEPPKIGHVHGFRRAWPSSQRSAAILFAMELGFLRNERMHFHLLGVIRVTNASGTHLSLFTQ